MKSKISIFLLIFAATGAVATSYNFQSFYPEEAIEECIEGWVMVEYSVSEGGELKDFVILDASPKGVFEEAALKWFRSEPTINYLGHGVGSATGVQQKLTFELDPGSFPHCKDL